MRGIGILERPWVALWRIVLLACMHKRIGSVHDDPTVSWVGNTTLGGERCRCDLGNHIALYDGEHNNVIVGYIGDMWNSMFIT